MCKTARAADPRGESRHSSALQRSLSAGALVGRAVSYTATDGSTQTGTVTAVSIDTTTNTSTAQIGGTSVDVGRITQVSA